MAFTTLAWDDVPPAAYRAGALTIGNFDGVHRGHTALLELVRQQARLGGGPAVALTFDPHPLQLLRPEKFLPVLTTMADRVALLQANGADHVAVMKTTPAMLQLRADNFFDRVIRNGLQARAVVEGPNFGFGRNREGNINMLQRLCAGAGIAFQVASPLEMDGRLVSSNRVRSALVAGNAREAATLLGRPYRLRGIVGTGQRRGQALGFPTANVERVATLIPGDGVYAVRGFATSTLAHPAGKADNREETAWPGAANIGPNPTFGEQMRKVEVHLIGFQGDLYGQPLAVDFIERLRDTRPFPSVTHLVEQLRRDVDQARQVITAHGE